MQIVKINLSLCVGPTIFDEFRSIMMTTTFMLKEDHAQCGNVRILLRQVLCGIIFWLNF